MKDVVVEILHTRDGSRVALRCLWHGTVKVCRSYNDVDREMCVWGWSRDKRYGKQQSCGMKGERDFKPSTVASFLHVLYVSKQNRKVIVKSFKPYVKKICMEENGHVVMMGVFDTVDDTVLVRKAILSVSSVRNCDVSIFRERGSLYCTLIYTCMYVSQVTGIH